jgi:phosphoribosylformylglycinamidine synthase
MNNVYQTINILTASDKELVSISKKGLLSLTLTEMRVIKQYFSSLGRNPTDCELETIAQTWSEHCKHKTLTSKARLVYYKKSSNGKTKKVIKKYNNVLKDTIFYATKNIKHKLCLSVFDDNAGIVEFDDKNAVAFKVETHNHPSALEPYGGAATGVGGVVRDIIGCGCGAKPVANTDVFCFGNIETLKKLPKGVHHPKRIFKGVISGVRDYGNRMGIPTVNGSIIFDDGYVYNPLVYCGCIGIIPKNKIKKKVVPGQLIILVGGKTGCDGIHGATFSSSALHSEIPTSVVQIGDAVTEKMFLDVLLKARDLDLFTAITDCGAGGLSSACGELTKDCGCEIYLENVPLKYEGLTPAEIWISESQERMVVIVDKDKKDEFITLCNLEDVEATVIGKVTDTKKLEVYFKKVKVCDIDMNFLHNGNPKLEYNLEYKNLKPKTKDVKIKTHYSLKKLVEKVFSHPNVCSKEWVIRQYDHEVQGNTVLKPLVGDLNICFSRVSPQDAAIIQPINDSLKGIAISCGINPLYGKYDIVSMTESVIDESIRNIICVGGSLNKIFLLDNFCWGDTTDETQLSSLVLSCETAKNVAQYFGTPFISGKDSLNNYFLLGNKKVSIPATLLISAISIIDDINTTISSELKSFDNDLYLIGETKNEFGGSVLCDVLNKKNFSPPSLNYRIAKKIYLTFEKLKPYILSAHDCSDGGVITSIIEMTFGRNIGVELNLSKVNDIIEFLFSESNSRIVVEISSENKKLFEEKLIQNKIPFLYLGKTVVKPYVLIKYKNEIVFNEEIEFLYNIWSKGLKV